MAVSSVSWIAEPFIVELESRKSRVFKQDEGLDLIGGPPGDRSRERRRVRQDQLLLISIL
jgi:hypothetical protein